MSTRKPPREDSALELLRDLGPAHELSARAKQRIWHGVQDATQPRSRTWLWATGLSGAFAAIALVAWLHHARPAPVARQDIVVPACGVAKWSDEHADRRAVVVGPGEALVGEQGVELKGGELVVTTEGKSLAVSAGTKRMTVAAHSVVMVTITSQGRVEIAAFSGTVQIATSSMTSTTLAAGRQWVDGSVSALDAASQDEATSVANGAIQKSGLCAAATAPVLPPATDVIGPPMPPAHGARAEAARAPLVMHPRNDNQGEADVLARALRALRTDHDARASLALLDQLGHGELEGEAALVRLEALQAIGDVGGALRLLDAQSLPNVARGWELLALRADLRARSHRCAEAIIDYTTMLQASHGEEEAYVGRAACSFERGARDEARRDLTDYLRRFPDGRHAGEARRALSATP